MSDVFKFWIENVDILCIVQDKFLEYHPLSN
jgi:hypothetical protein